MNFSCGKFINNLIIKTENCTFCDTMLYISILRKPHLQIAPEDILRLTVGDIPATTSFHPHFTQFSFFPRSIGSGDTYVEAALAIFKVLSVDFNTFMLFS